MRRAGTTVAILYLLSMIQAAPSAAQSGKPTPLLEDDLRANKRKKIDAPKDDLDAGLDAAFGGTPGFSTKELERITESLRAQLKRERPRATPSLLVFFYPGKVSVERLRSMSEIFVDLELVVDPCDRTVCRDSVGKHIELVGRAVGAAVQQKPAYKVVFRTLTLKAVTDAHAGAVETYRVPIEDCIAAGGKPGGGVAWLAALERADKEFEPLVTADIAKRAVGRRLAMVKPPSVARQSGAVHVALHVKGDRVRVQQQVMDALAIAGAALRANPKSPADSHLEVLVDVPMRKVETRRFRCPGPPLVAVLDGKMTGADFFASYVEEVKAGQEAQRMSFDDAEAAGRDAGGPAAEPDDNAALAVLNENFSRIAECAKAEAARNPAFRGVNVTMEWTPSGAVAKVLPKEPALQRGPLAVCLGKTIGAIRLPRFSGFARQIEYPIQVR